MNEQPWSRLAARRVSRRRMLSLSARTGVGAAGIALVGCGDDDDDDDGAAAAATPAPAAPAQAAPEAAAPATPELESVSLALDWVPNTNHTGFFVARNQGFYEEAGIDFSLIPYSGTHADTFVGNGQANFGISFQDAHVFSRSSGLTNISVMAILQHIGTEIAVVADRDDIQTPADLDGLTYAGFGLSYEGPIMAEVIRNAGGTGEFEIATLDTAAYEAVYSGRADFTVPFVAWEGIEAELRGQPLKTFKYTDYGFPDFYQVVMVSNEDWLADNEDLARRFVQASRRGFELATEDPALGAQLLIDENPGVFEDERLPRQSAVVLAEQFYLDDDGNFGTQTLERWTGYSRFLFEADVLADENGDALTTEPDWSTYFRNDLI